MNLPRFTQVKSNAMLVCLGLVAIAITAMVLGYTELAAVSIGGIVAAAKQFTGSS